MGILWLLISSYAILCLLDSVASGARLFDSQFPCVLAPVAILAGQMSR